MASQAPLAAPQAPLTRSGCRAVFTASCLVQFLSQGTTA